MQQRFKCIPAVYLVLFQEKNVLLLRRYNTGYADGFFSLIAGHLDGDEPLTVAMVREAHEEAGLIIQPEHLRLVHCMHLRSKIKNSTEDERFDFYFTTESYLNEPINCEPNKCDAMLWVPLNALPENTIPQVRFALENIQKNIVFSTFGWQPFTDSVG